MTQQEISNLPISRAQATYCPSNDDAGLPDVSRKKLSQMRRTTEEINASAPIWDVYISISNKLSFADRHDQPLTYTTCGLFIRLVVDCHSHSNLWGVLTLTKIQLAADLWRAGGQNTHLTRVVKTPIPWSYRDGSSISLGAMMRQ